MRVGRESKVPEKILSAARIVRKTILEANGGTSSQMCFLASEQLSKILKLLGYKAKFKEGYFHVKGYDEGHCWVEVNDHILDVTADQFNDKLSAKMASIVYGPKKQFAHLYAKD